MDNEIYTLVTITRMESYVDQDGKRGKKIEFIIVRPRINENSYSPESRIVKEVVTQLKTLGLPVIQQHQGSLKLIVYLLPEEEEALGVDFRVNNVYKLTFSKGSLRFEDVTREYHLVG